jgi:hypothetical protein
MLKNGGGQDARATVARASRPEPYAAIGYRIHNSHRDGIPNIKILDFTASSRFGSGTRFAFAA